MKLTNLQIIPVLNAITAASQLEPESPQADPARPPKPRKPIYAIGNRASYSLALISAALSPVIQPWDELVKKQQAAFRHADLKLAAIKDIPTADLKKELVEEIFAAREKEIADANQELTELADKEHEFPETLKFPFSHFKDCDPSLPPDVFQALAPFITQ